MPQLLVDGRAVEAWLASDLPTLGVLRCYVNLNGKTVGM
jgi:hypothetical protein